MGLGPKEKDLGPLGSPWACACRQGICCVSADKTSVVSADKTSVVSADKISVVSAEKTCVVSQDISILSTTKGRSHCVVDTIEMSWETTDVLSADTTDILSADTTNVLSADTTDVLTAETHQMSCLQTQVHGLPKSVAGSLGPGLGPGPGLFDIFWKHPKGPNCQPLPPTTIIFTALLFPHIPRP